MESHSKIYVSGHTGLVGSAMLRCLSANGYDNLLLRNSKELDLTNQAAVEDFFAAEKPDYVIHAAGKVGGIIANSLHPADYIYQNLMMAANTIHAAYRNGVKKLLFLGSSCIYPKLCPQPIKEEYLLTGALEPTNEAYALAKIAGLRLAKHYREQYGCNFISAMPTNLYGINDHFHPQNSHVLPALIRKMHLAKHWQMNDLDEVHRDLAADYSIQDGESLEAALACFGIAKHEDKVQLTLWGSGSPFREFLFVDDLASALLFLMNNYSADVALNIGTGVDIRIRDLAALIADVVGFQGDILWDSSKPDGTPRKLLDVSMLNSLGFYAKTELKDGLDVTYKWYLNRHCSI
ncbi:MAG: GDP-L-fucose synthase [Candidatus Cloacimonetes bacterium]|nr:GDP-L-fucose synthase [Candidatus Cloacimonadota bacterium]